MKEKSAHGIRFLICSLALILAFCFINTAHATNGYFANGYSVESKAMGGAGVALPLGSLDVAVNPANMAFVGTRIDLGLSLFNPNREYTVKGTRRAFPVLLASRRGLKRAIGAGSLFPQSAPARSLTRVIPLVSQFTGMAV